MFRLSVIDKMMSEEEAGWHAEADRVFAEVLGRAEAQPGSRADGEPEMEAAEWLVSLALRCGYHEYVEGWCLRLGRGLPPGHPMLGLSALCVGHLSRRFGYLSDQARTLVEELAERSRRDPADVDRRAIDGLGDVEWFIPRRPRLARVTRGLRRAWSRIGWSFGRS